MKRILKNIDIVILGLIAVIAVVLSIVEFFVEITWVEVPTITLMFIGMIGIHLVVSYFRSEDFESDASKQLKIIADNAQSNLHQVFSNGLEIDAYLVKRILEAEKSVCDLSWKNSIRPDFDLPKRKVTHSSMNDAISEASKSIQYREIFVFDDKRRISKLDHRLEQTDAGYSCRHYTSGNSIPRLQFVIIDDEEVLFYGLPQLCSFMDKELAKTLRSYFDMAFESARPIKDGNTLHEKEIEKLKKIRDTMCY